MGKLFSADSSAKVNKKVDQRIDKALGVFSKAKVELSHIAHDIEGTCDDLRANKAEALAEIEQLKLDIISIDSEIREREAAVAQIHDKIAKISTIA